MRRPAPPAPRPSLLRAVPASLARRARALPLRIEDGVLRVRSVDGVDSDPALDEMRVLVGAVDVTAEQDPDAVRHLLAVYARETLPSVLDDAVALLDTLLDLAAGSAASDCHLEATRDGLRVRMRIDGDLHDVASVPEGTALALIARTKVRSGLDVAERRLPQDGHLTHALPDGPLDVRVATMPTRWGERVALRLLPDDPGGVALDGLGLPDEAVLALEEATARSDGLVVVCGPTGSGKTTTLHALLTRISVGRRSIMTLEDPVERHIPGASQTQVDADHGLPFATGLRHLLRHDPDVLLVGEVRDHETARLAIEAARTGHLVLTSLHATDAPSALMRLHELGVPTGAIADTVALVVAQRLLAVPCPDCLHLPSASAACPGCAGTGTRGRSAIAEVLSLDAPLRDLLRDGRPPSAHHAALSAAVDPRLRTLALCRVGEGLARPIDAVRSTPDPSGVGPR
jgi:type II secretory ATPase GspE/PulE/Tfp pilus assembly ATPase PilB-like protein